MSEAENKVKSENSYQSQKTNAEGRDQESELEGESETGY